MDQMNFFSVYKEDDLAIEYHKTMPLSEAIKQAEKYMAQWCREERAAVESAAALAKFAHNSSYWPMQFPWHREYPCSFAE